MILQPWALVQSPESFELQRDSPGCPDDLFQRSTENEYPRGCWDVELTDNLWVARDANRKSCTCESLEQTDSRKWLDSMASTTSPCWRMDRILLVVRLAQSFTFPWICSRHLFISEINLRCWWIILSHTQKLRQQLPPCFHHLYTVPKALEVACNIDLKVGQQRVWEILDHRQFMSTEQTCSVKVSDSPELWPIMIRQQKIRLEYW
jgi:hypothetical protein